MKRLILLFVLFFAVIAVNGQVFRGFFKPVGEQPYSKVTSLRRQEFKRCLFGEDVSRGSGNTDYLRLRNQVMEPDSSQRLGFWFVI